METKRYEYVSFGDYGDGKCFVICTRKFLKLQHKYISFRNFSHLRIEFVINRGILLITLERETVIIFLVPIRENFLFRPGPTYSQLR